MDAGKRTINEIFNGSRLLEIPFFQRAYVWGETESGGSSQYFRTVLTLIPSFLAT